MCNKATFSDESLECVRSYHSGQKYKIRLMLIFIFQTGIIFPASGILALLLYPRTVRYPI